MYIHMAISFIVQDRHLVNVPTADVMMLCLCVQVDAALGRVDEVIEDLIVELKSRDIYDCVNIIIVSDHGETLR